MTANWAGRISAFSASPSGVLSGTTAEAFLAELLRELRDDRASYGVKVLLLSPLCEHPALLCPSGAVGEETALELMSVFVSCPPKSVQFRCHLLLALTSVLVCSCCCSSGSRASRDFLELLLQIAQDNGDLQGDGALRAVRATACDCLRELEACSPGLLAQRLELLGGLRQREASWIHQAYAGLQTLALRNAVYQLAQETGAGAEHLKALLAGNTAERDSSPVNNADSAILSSLTLGTMDTVPTLQTGPDCKELRSVLSSLLEDSYLLTPLCQAALLHRLTEVVAMVPGVPPVIFRAQLLRLLGTSELCLFHTTLLMKGAFTDSLFSAEDEAFLLKRLVLLSQHPLRSPPEKLFFMDCILHFPENRPIGCGDETLPVLLTPALASALAPTVFDDGATMLARLKLLSLVHLEEAEQAEGEEEEEEEEGGGLGYLYEHLASLRRIVEDGGSGEIVVTFFRSAFLFLFYFCHVERYAGGLVEALAQLYLRHTHLAPHLINLADQTQDKLAQSGWAVALLKALQGVVTGAPLVGTPPRDLHRHLRILARVAEEGEIPQQRTLRFLSDLITPSSSPTCASGDWRLGNGLLGVCRHLLVHPSLDSLLLPLADVLLHLAGRHGDTDVQDHARLYYALLTTLSREKLAGVLAHGRTEGGRQAKLRTLSSMMAEGEGLTSALTIHQAEKAVLVLSESPSEPPEETPADTNPNATASRPAEATAALDAYRAQFDDPSFASEIAVRYQLTRVDAGDARFDQIFSVCLRFSLTDGHYEELSNISVPCLFRDRPAPKVTLRLKPRRPRPTTLHASAVFTAQDGLTWFTDLPDVHLAFQQVFGSVPAPPSWGRGEKRSLFEGLWDRISRESGEEGSAGAASLFCCRLDQAALIALVTEHFLPYLVSDPSDEELRVFLFLPPQSHLLLKIRSEEDAAHFNIATDDWLLLPHMNSYLLNITALQGNAQL
ncbi:AP-5 complex subunit beta-1 [Brachionichthys hirsutus]|uniref:AP-5 complex subunit beta-1 n=1 Tax=Brachionichthys hirsutus TaxID=412623 RepID=UPI0036044565